MEEAPEPPPVHYETKFPFVPPDVEIFYEPARPDQPPVLPVYVPTAEPRQYVHMESFYSEPPMARSELYPQPGVAYDARETVQTITKLAPPPPAAAPVKERVERAEPTQLVEKLPPVVEEQIKKAVRLGCFLSSSSLSLP